MSYGTGPGRGVPWWRWRRVLSLSYVWGERGEEPRDRLREGRTVAVIKEGRLGDETRDEAG